MDEEKQKEIDLINAKIRLESLYETIETVTIPIENETQKQEMLKKLKMWKRDVDTKGLNEAKLQEFNEFILDQESWFNSFKSQVLSTVFIPQVVIYILFVILKLTPLAFFGYIYDLCFPMVLTIQGELWENGLGQYINISENSSLNRITIFGLLLSVMMSIITVTEIFELSYEWFIVALVIFPIILNGIFTKWVFVLVDALVWIMKESMDDFEKQKDPYKFGWHYIHLPILTIVLSSMVGILGFYMIGGIVSMLFGSYSVGQFKDIVDKQNQKLFQGLKILTKVV